MIRLTRLNGGVMYLNADLVATVEHHHDTVLTLVDGKTYVLQNTAEEVVDAVRDYRASILAAAERLAALEDAPERRAAETGARVLVLRPVTAPPADGTGSRTDTGAAESGEGR